MKHLLFLGILLSSPAILAETIKSKVYSVDNKMIKFANGRVAFVDKESPDISANDYLEVEIDDRSSLVSFKKMTPPMQTSTMDLLPEERPTTAPLFEASVVPSMEEAWNIFNRSNPNYKRISECTDRAHVWAHDEFKKTGTKSMKAFVFFTASYIDSTRFKWWFHVAPMYKVQTSNGIQDMVMDYRYTDRPMTVKEWTDKFVYTKRTCKVTTKFSEYDVNPQTENCYLIFESMHYKLPGEIHDQELSGRYKNETPESEVKAALRYAFQQ